MDTVIVAFENAALCQRFSELLEGSGTAKCLTCHSGDQVRRLLSRQPACCVICGPHLTDGPAEWLSEDLPPVCSLLLVGPQHMLDACSSQEIFKLATPIRKEEALSTVRLLLQFSHRLEKFVRPRRSGAEQELIDRAKRVLMEREGLDEGAAHRLLQKRSMDAGCRMVQTARAVLSQSGGEGPQRQT